MFYLSLIGAICWSLINKNLKLKNSVCMHKSEANSGRQSSGQINLLERTISIETEANNKMELYCSGSVLWQTLWSRKYKPHLI